MSAVVGQLASGVSAAQATAVPDPWTSTRTTPSNAVPAALGRTVTPRQPVAREEVADVGDVVVAHLYVGKAPLGRATVASAVPQISSRDHHAGGAWPRRGGVVKAQHPPGEQADPDGEDGRDDGQRGRRAPDRPARAQRWRRRGRSGPSPRQRGRSGGGRGRAPGVVGHGARAGIEGRVAAASSPGSSSSSGASFGGALARMSRRHQSGSDDEA